MKAHKKTHLWEGNINFSRVANLGTDQSLNEALHVPSLTKDDLDAVTRSGIRQGLTLGLAVLLGHVSHHVHDAGVAHLQGLALLHIAQCSILVLQIAEGLVEASLVEGLALVLAGKAKVGLILSLDLLPLDVGPDIALEGHVDGLAGLELLGKLLGAQHELRLADGLQIVLVLEAGLDELVDEGRDGLLAEGELGPATRGHGVLDDLRGDLGTLAEAGDGDLLGNLGDGLVEGCLGGRAGGRDGQLDGGIGLANEDRSGTLDGRSLCHAEGSGLLLLLCNKGEAAAGDGMIVDMSD